MFTRWGAFVYRFRRPVALLSLVVAVAAASLATQTSSALSSGGWLDATSESADVSARLDTQFDAGKSALIALFRADAAGDAAYVLIQLNLSDEDSVAAVDDIRAAIAPPDGYSYGMTGYGPITKDSAEQ